MCLFGCWFTVHNSKGFDQRYASLAALGWRHNADGKDCPIDVLKHGRGEFLSTEIVGGLAARTRSRGLGERFALQTELE